MTYSRHGIRGLDLSENSACKDSDDESVTPFKDTQEDLSRVYDQTINQLDYKCTNLQIKAAMTNNECNWHCTLWIAFKSFSVDSGTCAGEQGNPHESALSINGCNDNGRKLMQPALGGEGTFRSRDNRGEKTLLSVIIPTLVITMQQVD